MKYFIKNSEQGFAHPALLAILLIAVVSVVGFSGYKVISRDKSATLQNAPSAQGQIVIAAQNALNQETESETTTAEKLAIKSPGSAAEVKATSSPVPAPTATAQTGTIKVSNQYQVSTPMGSLSQMILEIQQGNYANVMYFVTPEFVSKAYSSVGAQNFDQFISNCQNNDACKMLASTKVSFDLSHVTENMCTPPSGTGFVECKKVGTKFVYENNELKTVYYKTVGYHVHEASVTMLRAENSTNWVINGVNVDNFSL